MYWVRTSNMVDPIVAINAGLILVILASVAGYTYLDAPEYGLDPVKWAALSFLIPIFGFFAYLFERDERNPDLEINRDEMFVGKGFEIHKSRADDAPWISSEEVETKVDRNNGNNSDQ